MPADIKKRKRTEVAEEADVSLELSALAQGAEEEHEDEDEEAADDIDGDEDKDDPPESSSAAAARTKDAAKSKKSKSKSKTPAKGIVFISRVPPGMTPSKIRHLMSRWGEVQRVYAQAKDAATGYNPNHAKEKKQKKHQSANFTEAWVEFEDKSIAKMVAKMLNAQVIGGKKGDRWRDDIWTMRYLSGFKWEMLGEQMAYERQVHQSRLRAEITRAKADQNEYLKNVELARVLKKREEKRAAAPAPAAGEPKPAAVVNEKAKRSYRQRQVADRAHGLEAKGMDSVLGSIFG
ncbi:Pre-rRNA-processing protein ESF2 [Vanrija pseudolonga]|uniref:18S rRNA factor 2 n=1 Tax=Vanrija pseudolonga TaxID=143232 RepID=A0AAF0YKJ5_9TREE|nr:Pre-rRNA-processing protein ESF2 [Vanrija pseudolonga]